MGSSSALTLIYRSPIPSSTSLTIGSSFLRSKPLRSSLLSSSTPFSDRPQCYGRRGARAVAVIASMAYERELAAAKKAGSLAAKLCQTVQKTLLQSDVHSKSDKSPVTVADYGSQALVSFVLEKELVLDSLSMVAEEDSADLRKPNNQDTLKRITDLINATLTADGTYNITLSAEDVLSAIDKGKSEGGPHGSHWVLDPIDGTKGFLRGDQYAIALALLDEGELALGVLACPNLPLTPLGSTEKLLTPNEVGCLFFAKAGGGTFMQPLDGSSCKKVIVSSIETPAEASFFESFEAAHSLHDLSSAIAKRLGVLAPPIRIDSQAKYGALARGDGAIYLRFPHKGYREKIWDHAAGSIAVTEAGGVVTDAAGKPLDFSKGRYLDLDTGIVVTNHKLMPLLQIAVQDAIKEKSHV